MLVNLAKEALIYLLLCFEVRHSTEVKQELVESGMPSGAGIHSVTHLLQSNELNFEAEKMYNLDQAKQEPHCSICHLFRQIPDEVLKRSINPNQCDQDMTCDGIPSQSYPYIPETVFCAAGCSLSQASAATDIQNKDEQPSDLLVCDTCKVCVHACKLFYLTPNFYTIVSYSTLLFCSMFYYYVRAYSNPFLRMKCLQ